MPCSRHFRAAALAAAGLSALDDPWCPPEGVGVLASTDRHCTCVCVHAVAGAAAGGSKEEWSGSHPWKPWDRDKDLNVPSSKPKTAADLMKAAGSLSNRFSSGR